MIKPYIKHEHTAKLVEVEDFGIIDLSELPIEVHREKKGLFEIDWVANVVRKGEEYYVLSEQGGSNQLNYGGRVLGVIREIE